MKSTINIKNRFSGEIIFSFECEENSIKKTVREAINLGADLSSANLSWANLSGAKLSGANFNENTSMFIPQCPDGSFIGWKKAGDKIIKIKICEDAKRSSATSLKCRCSKVKVIEIQELDGSKSDLTEVSSDFDENFIYKIGEIVSVNNFDENRWNECSTGIHFFISREMAVKYNS